MLPLDYCLAIPGISPSHEPSESPTYTTHSTLSSQHTCKHGHLPVCSSRCVRNLSPTTQGEGHCPKGTYNIMYNYNIYHSLSLPQVLCVLVSIGGVFIVAFFSTGKDKCLPVNNVTNATSFYNNDPCVPEQETSTPLGYVVRIIQIP